MANVIGVTSGAISIIQFAVGLFAAQKSNVCTVRVAAALNGSTGPSGGDGSLNGVRLHNDNQQVIGNGAGGYIGSGGFKDFQIQQINQQQATFVTIYSSNDALCIPYVTSTWVDGSRYGWVGDWGERCGSSWYYGNHLVDGSNYKPRCTWVDADHTDGLNTGTLMIRMPSFAGKAHGDNSGSYCGYPALRAYTDNQGSGPIYKTKKRAIDSRLIISSETSHNATELCASDTSRGPDFVSLVEGVYCNMETREIKRVCSNSMGQDCFDVDVSQSRADRGGNGAMEGAKTFSDIIHWD